MSQILLTGFWAADGNATIDFSNGSTIILSASPPDAQSLAHGWFHRIAPETTSAIFTSDDQIYLQINHQCWDIEKDRIAVRTYDSLFGTFWRTVVVYSGWKRVFRSRYCYFGGGGLSAIIPLDATDAETDDWWLFLSRNYPNQTAWKKCKAHLARGIKCRE